MQSRFEVAQLLELCADRCRRAMNRTKLPEEETLFEQDAAQILRVAFLLQQNSTIPDVKILGPGVTTIETVLAQKHILPREQDYVTYDDVIFSGDMYHLLQKLDLVILSRVQPKDGMSREISQAIFSQNFNPKRLRM